MVNALEMTMLICFGLSWPISIVKSFRARTAKGTSILFHCFIFIGYIAGIVSKIISDNVNYVLAFYILNACMVFVNIILYFRNKNIDRSKEQV